MKKSEVAIGVMIENEMEFDSFKQLAVSKGFTLASPPCIWDKSQPYVILYTIDGSSEFTRDTNAEHAQKVREKFLPIFALVEMEIPKITNVTLEEAISILNEVED